MCKEHERYYEHQAIRDNMIETLEAQIAADPQNMQLYWYLAPKYRVRKKDLQKTRELLMQAIQIDPTSIQAYAQLAGNLFEFGMENQCLADVKDEIIEIMEKQEELDGRPRSFLHGRLYQELGEYETAEKYFRQMERFPHDSAAVYNLADCLIKQDKPRDAILLIRPLLNEFNMDTGIWLLYHQALKAAGEHIRADSFRKYANDFFCRELFDEPVPLPEYRKIPDQLAERFEMLFYFEKEVIQKRYFGIRLQPVSPIFSDPLECSQHIHEIALSKLGITEQELIALQQSRGQPVEEESDHADRCELSAEEETEDTKSLNLILTKEIERLYGSFLKLLAKALTVKPRKKPSSEGGFSWRNKSK